jgi:hypothetical protein
MLHRQKPEKSILLFECIPHYTRGLAFVAQRTPTNDSKDASSGYPPPDPNGDSSFRIERQSSLATADGDGVQWTRALGISADVVSHIDGADRTEQAHAEAMNRALFPATWGYFLDTMMAPLASTETVESGIRTAAIGDLKNENLPFPVPNALLYRRRILRPTSIPAGQPYQIPEEEVLAPVFECSV